MSFDFFDHELKNPIFVFKRSPNGQSAGRVTGQKAVVGQKVNATDEFGCLWLLAIQLEDNRG